MELTLEQLMTLAHLVTMEKLRMIENPGKFKELHEITLIINNATIKKID